MTRRIDTRMNPDPLAFAELATFEERVEELLLGFSVVARAGEHEIWNEDSDWSGGVVLSGPGDVVDAAVVRRAIRIVASDMIEALDLQRGADTTAIALRIGVRLEENSLRVVWRFCAMQPNE